jgi:hypothetical protein
MAGAEGRRRAAAMNKIGARMNVLLMKPPAKSAARP